MSLAFLPAAVAQSYNPLNGLLTPPPGADQRSSGAPSAPGAGSPTQNSFSPISGAPPVASQIGSPGTPGTPPFTPDYKSLIANDPGLLMAEADLQASGVANIADRNAAFQRNVIDYGQLPDLQKAANALGLSAGDLQNIFGSTTGKLAQENTQAGTSILARLNAINSKSIQQIKNALAARGMYRSGETGYELGQQSQAYTNSQSDATKQLLDALSSAQGQYVSAEQQREIALAQAASDAANRQQQANPGSPGTPATPGTLADYSYTDSNGNPVYLDSSNRSYNADGTPYTGSGLPYRPNSPLPSGPFPGHLPGGRGL